MTRLVPKLIQSFLSNIFVYQPLYMYNDYINIDALAYNGDELTILELAILTSIHWRFYMFMVWTQQL